MTHHPETDSGADCRFYLTLAMTVLGVSGSLDSAGEESRKTWSNRQRLEEARDRLGLKPQDCSQQG
jgi:hypothetical protein